MIPSAPILAILVAATLALGACAPQATAPSTGAPRYVSLDALAAFPGGAGSAAPARVATPVAAMPDWIGRPVRLHERDGADAFEQAIALSPSARGDAAGNLIAVAMPRSGEASSHVDPAAPMRRPTEAGIRGEIDAAFPGVAMQVVPRPGTNAYGTYGLAIGRGARGAKCLYAWQWIEDAPVVDGAAVASGPVSLRVRLCRDDVTLEAMAAAVNQLRLVPPGRGVPVATAAASPPVQRPRSGVRSTPRPDVTAARRPDIETAAQRQPAARAAVTSMTVGASAVPGRRYLGVDGTADSRPSSYGAAPGGAGLRSVLAGPASGDVAPSSAAVTAQLPPEAYRGPSVSSVRETPR